MNDEQKLSIDHTKLLEEIADFFVANELDRLFVPLRGGGNIVFSYEKEISLKEAERIVSDIFKERKPNE